MWCTMTLQYHATPPDHTQLWNKVSSEVHKIYTFQPIEASTAAFFHKPKAIAILLSGGYDNGFVNLPSPHVLHLLMFFKE